MLGPSYRAPGYIPDRPGERLIRNARKAFITDASVTAVLVIGTLFAAAARRADIAPVLATTAARAGASARGSYEEYRMAKVNYGSRSRPTGGAGAG